MSIQTNSLIVHGNVQGTTLLSAGTVSGATGSALNIAGDVAINGSVLSKGRIQFSDTMFLTMRPPADIVMQTNEHFITGSDMLVDPNSSDATSLSQLTDVLTIWNWNNGSFVIPMDGLYTMELQGSFSNTVPNALNGVYWYMRSETNQNSRVAANINNGPVVSASTTRFFLAGDVVQPVFYSSDPNSTLLANGETYVSSVILNTLDVDQSKYTRVPPNI